MLESDGVSVGVNDCVAVKEPDGVRVAVSLDVSVCDGDCVDDIVCDPVTLGVRVAVGVWLGLRVSDALSLALDEVEGVRDSDGEPVLDGDPVCDAVAVGEGVEDGEHGISCTTRRRAGYGSSDAHERPSSVLTKTPPGVAPNPADGTSPPGPAPASSFHEADSPDVAWKTRAYQRCATTLRGHVRGRVTFT